MKTVEIQCVIGDDRPSYMIGGVRQQIGDRARIDYGDALTLISSGKAKIVKNSEKLESVPTPADPPPRPKQWLQTAAGWNVSSW